MSITQAQVNKWKETYGDDLFLMAISKGGKKYVGAYHVQFNRQDFTKIQKMTYDGDIFSVGVYILQNNWLGGNEELRDFDNKLGQTASIEARRSFTFLEAEVQQGEEIDLSVCLGKPSGESSKEPIPSTSSQGKS